MKSFEKHQYRLILSGKEKRSIERKEQDGKAVNFKGAVNQKKVPKLYILKHEGAIIYVGFTSQGIGSRLSGGIWADGRSGYHGYKWKVLDEVDLLIFVFDDTLTDGKKDPKKEYYETIEAELVFKIRNETGKYPKYQNEIHFRNEYLEEVKGVVEEIYAAIINKNDR